MDTNITTCKEANQQNILSSSMGVKHVSTIPSLFKRIRQLELDADKDFKHWDDQTGATTSPANTETTVSSTVTPSTSSSSASPINDGIQDLSCVEQSGGL